MALSAGGRYLKRGTAWWKIVLIVLALLIAVLGLLAWRFRDEIKAFAISRQYSAAELEAQLADNDQTIRNAMDASSDVTVRAPTDEEREALRSGSLTQDELIGRLTGGEADTAPFDGTQPDASEAEASSDYQKQLSELVAQVYVLREDYLGELAALEASARADYAALTESQRTGTKLASMVSDYLARATKLEKECDGKMDDIIGKMEKLIKENNGDMSLTDTVFDTYVQEKSIKKAWYISRMQEKGLI